MSSHTRSYSRGTSPFHGLKGREGMGSGRSGTPVSVRPRVGEKAVMVVGMACVGVRLGARPPVKGASGVEEVGLTVVELEMAHVGPGGVALEDFGPIRKTTFPFLGTPVLDLSWDLLLSPVTDGNFFSCINKCSKLIPVQVHVKYSINAYIA